MYPAARLARKFEPNHAPIMNDTMRAGASLVTIDSPTGDRQSSPIVCQKYAPTIHQSAARPDSPASAWFTPWSMKTKPSASRIKPKHILIGAGGSSFLRASLVQNHANSGAKMKMIAGLTV